VTIHPSYYEYRGISVPTQPEDSQLPCIPHIRTVESETAQCGFVGYNDLQGTMTIIEQTCLWKRNYDPIYIASVNDVQGSIFLNIGYSLSINHYLCFESKLFSLIMTDNSNLQFLGTRNFIRQNLAKTRRNWMQGMYFIFRQICRVYKAMNMLCVAFESFLK
jgi:hypothetical protein